ncbi:DUF86 domain-containing protein [Clostridium cochlearium]|uniref:DUF86 domain-containing protein n=1 Tax=Clostridium cochlearium TaxID=1494 RepID=A0A7Y3V7C1_CLOCO|nr:DUF86 domain-containing protein [Clostridium cochlearium]MBV1821030.1 DUF86 domain-containing protein [Bacteroidales bacterium MSK.15.36]NSJ91950.1 DUF86 domain-containing protein [Coprococcus sp. MSK.21.13]MCG4571476.1 DUF86 domain-containing protein [Clostridium cochlearium]MCG4581115.1 DUF86 domain-containing protein [Clostridium cochlearium]NOH16062.1 DUF86 domain-containing protein [Clostridium cochlearium]
MTRNVLETINSKIKELQKNLILLKSVSLNINKDNLKEDMIKYWGIERGIQICIECVIDISNVIISTLDIEKPDTYKECILVLGNEDIIPQRFAKQISNMVSFRNILVHDYMKIDEEIIINVLKNNLDDFAKFMNYINQWIKEKNY